MKGTLLRLYVHENRRHRHLLLYEWLLEQARKDGIRGGTAFRAIGGFGRHGIVHEEHFFELANDLVVALDFVVTDAEADALLASIRAEGIRLVYARIPIEFGTVDADGDPAPGAPG